MLLYLDVVAGKSTIVALLQRFYDQKSGEILVDDISIADIDVNQYRQYIAVVGQEPKLFNMSIEENIVYGIDRKALGIKASLSHWPP
jgi:ATP-binding cassette subfamily B (MDR/TAP) protein 1